MITWVTVCDPVSIAADPTRTVVGLSGDYDFQFLIEELAVGAQFRLPYVQVLVNNSYLGLIRQSQRGFEMDYCVQLGFENINSKPGDVTAQGYGVDHVKVVDYVRRVEEALIAVCADLGVETTLVALEHLGEVYLGEHRLELLVSSSWRTNQ